MNAAGPSKWLISDRSSKRVEAQLQEIEQKSEKKKLEVRAPRSTPLYFIYLLQLVEIQTELQQHQKQDGSGGPAASVSPSQ